MPRARSYSFHTSSEEYMRSSDHSSVLSYGPSPRSGALQHLLSELDDGAWVQDLVSDHERSRAQRPSSPWGSPLGYWGRTLSTRNEPDARSLLDGQTPRDLLFSKDAVPSGPEEEERAETLVGAQPLEAQDSCCPCARDFTKVHPLKQPVGRECRSWHILQEARLSNRSQSKLSEATSFRERPIRFAVLGRTDPTQP
jgi:hypothetical protein